MSKAELSEILREKDGTEYQLVDGWLFRRLPGASGWVPAYGYEDLRQRKEALGTPTTFKERWEAVKAKLDRAIADKRRLLGMPEE